MNNYTCIGNISHEPKATAFNRADGSQAFALRTNVAVNYIEKRGEDPKTVFIPTVFFVSKADVLKVGDKIAINGEFRDASYTDKDNVQHYGIQLVVNNWEFCIPKKYLQSGAPQAQPQPQAAPQNYAAPQAPTAPQAQAAPQNYAVQQQAVQVPVAPAPQPVTPAPQAVPQNYAAPQVPTAPQPAVQTPVAPAPQPQAVSYPQPSYYGESQGIAMQDIPADLPFN